MGPLSTYYKLRMANPQVQLPGEAPLMPVNSQQPQQPAVQPQQPQTMPQVDTSNAINSLAGMLVTPAEREARQQKLMENKRRMIAWTGLFDGLRNLGNLYSVSKGAAPQKYTDNPYQAIEQNYQHEIKNLDDAAKYSDNYAKQIWNLRRQASEDARKEALSAAQARYYDTRDEVARMKAENDRLKAEKYVQLQDGRIAKINAETGKIMELLPLNKQEIESRINKNNRSGGGRSTGGGRNNGTYGYRTTRHVDPATGDIITERVPTSGGKPGTKTTPKKDTSKKNVKKEKRQSRIRI